MKRGAICTAAQEDEDSDEENAMVVKPPTKKAIRRNKETETAESAKPSSDDTARGEDEEPKKKEKAFAWMDSDEEEPEKEEKGDSKTSEEKKEKEEADEDDENADVSASVMDEVSTFGKMMVLSPALLKKMGRMPPEDVAAACRALGRTKFFDGDIIRILNDVLQRLLMRDRLNLEQANDALQCLWTLNAYDQKVLTAVSRQFKVRTGLMDVNLRSNWLEIYKAFGHKADPDMLQLLEVPALTAVQPGYKRLRCKFVDKGTCAVGEACTYSHDPRAPVELEGAFIRPVSKVMMTQTQSQMGKHIYGGMKNGQVS